MTRWLQLTTTLLVLLASCAADAGVLYMSNFAEREPESYVPRFETIVGSQYQSVQSDGLLALHHDGKRPDYRCLPSADFDSLLTDDVYMPIFVGSGGRCSSTTSTACVGDADCPAGETCVDQPLPDGQADFALYTLIGSGNVPGTVLRVRRNGDSLVGEVAFRGLEPFDRDVAQFELPAAGANVQVRQHLVNASTMGVSVRVDGKLKTETNVSLEPNNCASSACDINTVCFGTWTGEASSYNLRFSEWAVSDDTDFQGYSITTVFADADIDIGGPVWTRNSPTKCDPNDGSRRGCIRNLNDENEEWCSANPATSCGGAISRGTGTPDQWERLPDLSLAANESLLAVRAVSWWTNNSTTAGHGAIGLATCSDGNCNSSTETAGALYRGTDHALAGKQSGTGAITWVTVDEVWDVDPATSSAWTESGYNQKALIFSKGSAPASAGEPWVQEAHVYTLTSVPAPAGDRRLPSFSRCVQGTNDTLGCIDDSDCPGGTCYDDLATVCLNDSDSILALTGAGQCQGGECGERACTTDVDCVDLGGLTQGTGAYCNLDDLYCDGGSNDDEPCGDDGDCPGGACEGICQTPCSLDSECGNCGSGATCPALRSVLQRLATDGSCDVVLNSGWTGMGQPFLTTALHEVWTNALGWSGLQVAVGDPGFCWPGDPDEKCADDGDCSTGGDVCYPYLPDHVFTTQDGNGTKANLPRDCNVDRVPLGVPACQTYTPTHTPTGTLTPSPTATDGPSPTPTRTPPSTCERNTECPPNSICNYPVYSEAEPQLYNQWGDQVCPRPKLTPTPGEMDCPAVRCDDQASDPWGRDDYCEQQLGPGSECEKYCEGTGNDVIACNVTGNVCGGTSTACTDDTDCVGVGNEECQAAPTGGRFASGCSFCADPASNKACPANAGVTSGWWCQACSTGQRCMNDKRYCTCPLGAFSCSGPSSDECRVSANSMPFVCLDDTCAGDDEIPAARRDRHFELSRAWEGETWSHSPRGRFDEHMTNWVEYSAARASVVWWIDYVSTFYTRGGGEEDLWGARLLEMNQDWGRDHPNVIELQHYGAFKGDRQHVLARFNLFGGLSFLSPRTCSTLTGECAHWSALGIDAAVAKMLPVTERSYLVCSGDETVPCEYFEVPCSGDDDCCQSPPCSATCDGANLCACSVDGDCDGDATCEDVDGTNSRCVSWTWDDVPPGNSSPTVKRSFRPSSYLCDQLGDGVCSTTVVPAMCSVSLLPCDDDSDCLGYDRGDVCVPWGHWLTCRDASGCTPATGVGPTPSCDSFSGDESICHIGPAPTVTPTPTATPTATPTT